MEPIEVSKKCPMCGKKSIVSCDPEGYSAWEAGELIQRAFLSMSAEDRELLITGICSACWKVSFPEDI